MDRRRLRSTAAWWRNAVMTGAIIFGFLWLIFSFQAAQTFGEFNGGAFLFTFVSGAIGIALTAGLYLILTALLDGVAGVIDHVEKLSHRIGAVQPAAETSSSSAPRSSTPQSASAAPAPSLTATYGSAVSRRMPVFPSHVDAEPVRVSGRGSTERTVAALTSATQSAAGGVVVLDWEGRRIAEEHAQILVGFGIRHLESDGLRGFGLMNAPASMREAFRAAADTRGWEHDSSGATLAVWKPETTVHRCPSCAEIVAAGDRFCGVCGNAMMETT